MSFTKEELETLKKDKGMQLLATLFGVDFDELIKEAEEKSDKKEEDSKKYCSSISSKSEGDKNYETDTSDYDPVEDYGTSFSMTEEELAEFIKNYRHLEDTFRKLEHAYGVDLNANADSIYTQYNALVWDLIEKIFGEDNRDDIADFCFGDSNLETVHDLYEELI